MKYIIAAEILEELIELALKSTHHDKTAEDLHDFIDNVRRTLEPFKNV